MPLYRYDSYNRRGGRVKATIDAPSVAAAKELLRGQGLMPIASVQDRAAVRLVQFQSIAQPQAPLSGRWS